MMKPSFPVLVLAMLSLPTPISGAWKLGCFSESPQIDSYRMMRALTEMGGVWADSAKECTSVCYQIQRNDVKKYAYAYLDNLDNCLCSDVAPTGGTSLDASCETLPVCDMILNDEGCDSDYYAMAHDTTDTVDDLQVTVPSLIIAGSTTTITTTLDSGADASLTYTCDYGDGSTPVPPQADTSFTYTYMIPGVYFLVITATNDYSLEVTTTVTVTVMGEIDAAFDCPDPLVFEVNLPIQCPLRMYTGSSVNATMNITFEGTGMVVDFTGRITDAVVNTHSLPLSLLLTVGTNTGRDGVTVMPALQIESDGTLISLDAVIYATGFLRVLIFRPPCVRADFCPMNRKCNDAGCAKQTLNSVTLTTTTADYRDNPMYTYTGLQARILVAEYLVYVLGPVGLVSIPLLDRSFHMLKGDIVALGTENGECQVASIAFQTEKDFYYPYEFYIPELGVPLPGPTSGFVADIQLQARAHFSYAGQIDGVYLPTQIGFIQLNSTLVNEVNEVYPTKRVPVQERISGLAIVVPQVYTAAGYEIYLPITLAVAITTGSSVTYEWVIIHEGAEVFRLRTTTTTTVFTPTSLGHYFLTVTAFNLLGEQNQTVDFGVHRRILNVAITRQTPGSNRIITVQDVEYSFRLEIDGGSNATTIVDFGDGTPTTTDFLFDAGNFTYHQYHNHTYRECARLTLCVWVTSFIGNNFTNLCINVENSCPITNARLVSNPPIASDGNVYLPTNTRVEFQAVLETGSFVLYSFTWGDGDVETFDHSQKVFPEIVHWSRYQGNVTVLNISVTAVNSISSFSQNLSIIINRCTFPFLVVDGTNIESSPLQLTTGRSHTSNTGLYSGSNLDCPPTTCTYPMWKIEERDVNKTFQPFTTLPDNTLTPSVTIMAGSLPVGIFQMLLVQQCGALTVEYPTYISVSETSLSCSIQGAYIRTAPFSFLTPALATEYYKVTFDASTSYDPDLRTVSATTLSLKFYCRRLSNATAFTAAQTARVAVTGAPYDGTTCDHTDIRPFPSANNLDPSSADSILVDSSMFLEDISYEITVKANESSPRACNFSQTVVFRGGAPNVDIICVKNCQAKVNHQEQLVYTSRCSGCEGKTVSYQWRLLNGSGSPLPLDQSTSPDVTTTGWNQPSFVLLPGVLLDGQSYRLEIGAEFGTSVRKRRSTPQADTSSYGLVLQTSELPQGGKCVLSQFSSRMGESSTKAVCQDWYSSDCPCQYEVTYLKDSLVSPGQGPCDQITNSRTWFKGDSPVSTNGAFPIGISNTCLFVINRYGARVAIWGDLFETIQFSLPSLTIVPGAIYSGAPTDDGTDPVLDLVNSWKPPLGSAQQIAQWASAVDSVIDAKAMSAQPSTIYADGVVEINVPSEDIGTPNTERDLILATTASNINIRAALIDGIVGARVETLADYTQLGESLQRCTNNPQEHSAYTLVEASRGVEDLTKAASLVLTGSEGANEIVAAVDGFLASISNLFEATKEYVEKATRDDDKVAQNAGIPIDGDTIGIDPERNHTKDALDIAKQTTDNLLAGIDQILNMVQAINVVGSTPLLLKQPNMDMGLRQINVYDFSYEVLRGSDAAAFTMPGIQDIFPNVQNIIGPIDSRNVDFKLNIFPWDTDGATKLGSGVSSLELRDGNGDMLSVQDSAKPISLEIKNKPEKISKVVMKMFYPGQMIVENEKVKHPKEALLLGFRSLDNCTANFTCYIQYGKAPTFSEYDFKIRMQSAMYTHGSAPPNTGAIPPSTGGHYRVIDDQSIMITDFTKMRYNNITNTSLYIGCTYTGDTPSVGFETNRYTFDELEERRACNLTAYIYTPSCCFFDHQLQRWSREGIEVNPNSTNFDDTTCETNHLSAFGGFQVKPEPIPALSLDMLKNGFVLLLSVLLILLFYALACIYARKSDKKDIQKVGVCPLPSNDSSHRYRYEITVFTGMRRNAGTDSNVFLVLSGEFGETKVKMLEDPERKILSKNSSDSFVFTNVSDLGELSHVRIWHDNSKGGWYLRNIIVTDLQREKQYNFLCSRWLSVGEDDGEIERLLPVSGPEELSDFNYVFATKTRQDLSDTHLWFSIYARPPRSSFTRVQRLSCCLSLLMTTMMASAMFYRVMPQPTPATQNSVNGIQFTWGTVFVSLITTLITVPINVIIVTIFRSARRKGAKKTPPPAVPSCSSGVDEEAQTCQESVGDNSVAVALDDDGNLEKVTTKKKKKKEPFSLPHWTVYIGWMLVFISVVTSCVMVTIYGMVFGNKTSLDWLASVMLSFFQDVIVTQPLKVFLLAVFVASIIKKIEDLDARTFESRNKKLASDEEWLHRNRDPTKENVELEMSQVRPPDKVKLAQMRELRLKEKSMHSITKEIFTYTIFVIIAFSIAFSLRPEIAYRQTQDLNELFKIKHRDVDDPAYTRLRKVYSYNDFWTWMEDVMLPVLFPLPWYPGMGAPNPTETFPGKLFIEDINSKLVNGVRLRQLRIKPDSCKKTDYGVAFIDNDCAAAYSFLEEQKQDYYYNWTLPASFPLEVSRRESPWRYQDWAALDGYPFWGVLETYFGGGFAVELFPKFKNREIVENLKKLKWLDRHTRALFVEFSVFNAASNHFSMVTILFEFPPTGGIVHYASVMTFKMYRYTTGFAFFVIVCEVLFILFVLYFAYREFKVIRKERTSYFKGFWNLVELSIVLLSFVAGGFYGYRSVLATELLQKMPAKKPQRFINFQFAAYWDQVFVYIVALIVFFVTIKFIKLLRFNRRVSMLQSTLSYSLKPLGMFSAIMGMVIYATCLFTNLVFGPSLEGYSNLFKTTASQMSLLLGKFSYSEYEDTNRVLGPVFFLMYNIVVNWILVNMLISIVNDAFATVCADLQEQSNDYEMVDFMLDKFKVFIGVGGSKKSEMIEDINWKKTSATADVIDTLLDYDSPESKKRAGSITSLEFYADLNKKPPINCNQIEVASDDDDNDDIKRAKRWRNAETTFLNADNEMPGDALNQTIDRFISCIDALYLKDG